VTGALTPPELKPEDEQLLDTATALLNNGSYEDAKQLLDARIAKGLSTEGARTSDSLADLPIHHIPSIEEAVERHQRQVPRLAGRAKRQRAITRLHP
jgi:hypothetical protein